MTSLTANQEQLPQPRCIFGKHWELGMGIQKVRKQSLLLNLALSRKRRLSSVQTLPVLITGGRGGPCDTCGNLVGQGR